MELLTVPIDKPDDLNLILGQSHFIKTVEDLHEVLAGSSPICGSASRSASRRASGSCAVQAMMTSSSSWPPATCSPSERATRSWYFCGRGSL